MNRARGFVLAMGVAGLIVGRTLPRSASGHAPDHPAASAAPGRAPLGCDAERTQLASLRAQLGICLALRAPSSEPEPAPYVTSTPALPTVPSPTVTGHPEQANVVAMLASVSPKHVAQVIVRHADGTLESYPAEDWPADRTDEQIIARESPEHLGYYETDAGLMTVSDLVGADGVIKSGGITFVYLKHDDAGAP